MNKEREDELILIKAIKDGNEEAWKQFVSHYSDLIFNSIRHWCQPYCRKSHKNSLCPWKQAFKANTTMETCGEVIDMYLFTLSSMRKRIVKFRGESKLSTFIIASLRYVKLDYFRQKYGRLQLPLVIKKSSKITQEVYRLLCRGKEKEHIAGALNISREEVKTIENDIRTKLREKRQEWQHLDGWIAMKSEPQPLVTENDDEIIDQTPAYFDDTPEEREISYYLINGMKTLSLTQQRLLQLRFQKRLSVSEIVSMLNKLKILNVRTEKEIYKEIDEALANLSKFIKSHYALDQNVTNEVKKCVKELLEKLMLSSEKEKE